MHRTIDLPRSPPTRALASRLVAIGTAICAASVPPVGRASPPEDIDLASMVDQDGERVPDEALLGAAYEQLIVEAGTMVANKPMVPASTTGIYGWETSFYVQWVFNEASLNREEVSPWQRAHHDEDARSYQFIPTFAARKGLPLSSEVGVNVGWIGNSNTGVVGGYGRIAVLEGFKPWPDITLQLGQSGYVGNDQLNLSVTDLSVTVGTTYTTGAVPGVNTARIAPWATVSSLRIAAAPNLDPGTTQDIGAVVYQSARRYDGESVPEPRLIVPQLGAGFQIVSQTVHVRMAVTWAWSSIPTLSTGMGFTF